MAIGKKNPEESIEWRIRKDMKDNHEKRKHIPISVDHY
jgi:hypothetical protein